MEGSVSEVVAKRYAEVFQMGESSSDEGCRFVSEHLSIEIE